MTDTDGPKPASTKPRRVTLLLGTAVLLLALVETVNAVVAPRLAPTDRDWESAAQAVRAGHAPGDLIVAAPLFADPLLRLHLGDLLPQPMVGRMDDRRFGRIWEISQRGAQAQEVLGDKPALDARHGALIVRRYDRKAARLTYDFFMQWRNAHLSFLAPGGREVPCGLADDRHRCSEGNVSLKPQLLEIDTRPRAVFSTVPVQGGTTVLEFPQVPMGSELAVGAGLHNVWLRKGGDGVVQVRILVDGQERAVVKAGSRTGFTMQSIDTSALFNRRVAVRFEITSDQAAARHLGFVAEARTP